MEDRSAAHPFPHTGTATPLLTSPSRAGRLSRLTDLHPHIEATPGPQFALLVLCGTGPGRCVMPGTHLYPGSPQTCRGSVPDHRSTVSSTAKRVTGVLWSPVLRTPLSVGCVGPWVRSGRCVLWAHSPSLHTQSALHARTSLTQVGGFPVGLSASSQEASDAETSVAESTDGETEENGGHGE